MLQAYMVWQRRENNYRFTKNILSQHNYWSICDNYAKILKLSKMLYLVNIRDSFTIGLASKTKIVMLFSLNIKLIFTMLSKTFEYRDVKKDFVSSLILEI